MNIRPMDMQVLIPRSTEVARNQQITDQQNMQQQQQFAAEWKKIADNRQNQVQSSSKAEDGRVKAKEERESRKNHHRQTQEDQDAETAKDNIEHSENHLLAEDPLRGHKIDIKM
jgi:hypothetical protein